MPVQIGAKPDSGFSDPIGMLMDCHRRVEHFLNILCIVVERAQGRAMDGEESDAIEAALAYFRTGGRRHNADEEESLFPRMMAACPGEEIAGLEHDHRDAAPLHAQVEELYTAWSASGPMDAFEERDLLNATRRLAAIYKEHIALEENVVFPRAAAALSPEAIAQIGEEFRLRRA